MKKLVLLLSVVFVTMSSFSTLENATCHDYAQAAVASESQAYGVVYGFSEYAAAYTFYYNACIEAGGNIDGPVHL